MCDSVQTKWFSCTAVLISSVPTSLLWQSTLQELWKKKKKIHCKWAKFIESFLFWYQLSEEVTEKKASLAAAKKTDTKIQEELKPVKVRKIH